MLSHVDCNTLDRFAESSSRLMQQARARGYTGGFSCVVFDHDQAYRRVKRSDRFRCIVPVVSPGGSVIVRGDQVHVPSSRIVYHMVWRLLFGEAGAVAGYCVAARTVAAVIAKVLRLPPGHYIDNFIAVLMEEDHTAVDDLWRS